MDIFRSSHINRAIGKIKSLAMFSVLCFALTSCAWISPFGRELQKSRFRYSDSFNSSGSLLLTSPLPSPAPLGRFNALAFMPVDEDIFNGDRWLDIDTEKKTLTIKEGSNVIASGKIKILPRLQRGFYNIMMKQQSPIWYAPDSYFTRRGKSVPPQGAFIRYRKGALGDMAIFLKDASGFFSDSFSQAPLSIHSAPVYDRDVGGIWVKKHFLKTLFSALKNGDSVRIR